MPKVLHNWVFHAPLRVAGERSVVLQGSVLQQELSPADEEIRSLVRSGRGHMDCCRNCLDRYLPDSESELGTSGGLHINCST